MSSLSHFARLLILPTLGWFLISCETTKTGTEAPYASNYDSDGRYNPYPGQSGHAEASYQPPSYTVPPTYTTPPAPVEANPYAFQSSSSASKPASSGAPKKQTTASAKPKSSPAAKKSTSSSTYTVVKGDTLYGIAVKKGSSVAKIKAANSLSSDMIQPGQKLKVP